MEELMEVRRLATLPGVCLAWRRISMEPALLTARERLLYDALTNDKRRAEWCSGRVCAREALAAAGCAGVSILSDERGLPRLEGALAGAHVSISHGRRIAAAVAGVNVFAGVDIVDLEDEDRVKKIAHRVLTPKETELVAREKDAALLAWGTREAIAKATSTGMFMFALSGAPVVAIDRTHKRVETELEGIEVHYESLEDGGVLVVAGATRDARARARTKAGLGT